MSTRLVRWTSAELVRAGSLKRACRDRLAERNSVIWKLHFFVRSVWRRFTWRAVSMRSISKTRRKPAAEPGFQNAGTMARVLRDPRQSTCASAR